MVGEKTELRVELITAEIAQLVAKRLTPRQQQSLDLLRKGCGVRETARQLGISHPAVIKHRRKIARLVTTLEKPGRATTPAPQFAGQPTGYVGAPQTLAHSGTARLPVKVTSPKGTLL